MRFHFIGICGAGMSGVAKLLMESGHQVSGSDEGFYPPISDYLKENNIPCASPYSPANIPSEVDVIVIGKHAKLVPEENEEVAYAFSHHKEKVKSYPEVLADILRDREQIVVAGSYGKSTSTSLLAWCLEDKGAGYLIGALPLTPKTNASVGNAKEFILEGDEYPSSNWDSTSKFLHYTPQAVLLTALAHDHVNIFKTHDAYIAPFLILLAKESLTTRIICGDDETVAKVLPTLSQSAVTYGLNEKNTWSAKNILWDNTTSFVLTRSGEEITTLTTSLLGKHNIQNIIGVCALILEKELLTKEELKEKVASFKGLVRRLDKKSEHTALPVYEGFGSSVDKARSAIDAIRLHFPTKRLVVVFEPHTFSWRNRAALSWYDTVFNGTNEVFIYKPPEHGSSGHDQLSHEEIVSRVANTGITTSSFETPHEGVEKILTSLTKDDIVLILSSGGMDGFLPEFISSVEQKFPLL